MDESIYIVDCRRTAIAAPFKGLKEFTVSQLAAAVISEIVRQNKVSPESISEVILGNTVSAGTGQNFSRHALMLAGLPLTTPAYSVNNVCGSGLQAVILASQTLTLKKDGLIVAGASESATHSPNLLPKKSEDSAQVLDSVLQDGLFCNLSERSMGEICEDLIAEFKISREEQDQFTFQSHRKACAAKAHGKFKPEIVPVKKSDGSFFSEDERPRDNISLERLARLPVVFREGGSVTAGNACSPSDGACAFLLAGQTRIQKNNLRPLARIIGEATIAVDPKRVFSDGTKAIEDCLQACGFSLKDIDLFEVTEAFAAQAVLTRKKLKIPEEKMNIWGGDLALGHPLGIAGSRALTTLVHGLIDQKKKLGLVYTPFGAGGAIAMMVENIQS